MRPEPSRWRPWQRVAFRFAFAYFLLYSPLLVVANLEGFSWLVGPWTGAWARVVPPIAAHVFGLRADFPDTTDAFIDVRYSFVRLGCVLLLATLITTLWSLLARARSYERPLECLKVLVRYGLASEMLRYGLAKVFVTQFGDGPSLETLVEPYGDLRPFQLMWNFMAHSSAYTIFCGSAECACALLLLFRRTTTLGALLLVGVMANVVMLDFCYDVPVKLYATHLFLMAALLAAPDVGRVLRLLVLRETTNPPPDAPHFEGRGTLLASWALKACIVATVVLVRLHAQAISSARAAEGALVPALYGIWEVQAMTRDGAALPPPSLGEARWKRLVVDRARSGPAESNVTLWRTDDAREALTGVDDATGTWVLEGDRAASKVTLAYTRVDGDHLVVEGLIDGAVARVTLTRTNPQTMRLLARRFRWSVGDRLFGGDAG